MLKIRIQIEHLLNNIKFTNSATLEILERAEEQCQAQGADARTEGDVSGGAPEESGTSQLAPVPDPVFKTLKLTANISKRFTKFKKFIYGNLDHI